MTRLPYIWLCVILVLGSGTLTAQSDTMFFSIPAGDARTAQLYADLNEAGRLVQSQPQVALDKIEKAIELSLELEDQQARGWSYHTFGVINYKLGRYPDAADKFEKALKFFSATGDNRGVSDAHRNIALARERAGQPGEALSHYLVLDQEAQASGNPRQVINSKENLARIYYKMRAFEPAIKEYESLVKLYRARSDEEGVAQSWNNLGTIFLEKGDTANALKYYDLAIRKADVAGDTVQLIQGYTNLGNVYIAQQRYSEGTEVQQQAVDLGNKNQRKQLKGQNTYQTSVTNSLPRNGNAGEPTVVNDIDLRGAANYNLAQSYLRSNNTIAAIPYLKNSVLLTRESGDIAQEEKAVVALSEAFEEVGDYENALKAYKEYVRIADSLEALRDAEALSASNLSAELAAREERIALLEQTRSLAEKERDLLKQESQSQRETLNRQRWIGGLLLGLLLVVIGAAILIWRSARARRRANQLLALKSLRSQMNPHFIFNSLNSINSFISRNDERSANKFLSEFSRLMRSVLENSKEEFIPLSKEIEILGIYLNLEHYRFSDKFDYTFEVDPELEQDLIQVPPMLIQPYIENAIWHGLRYRESKGELSVKMYPEGRDWVCVVEDNGIGRERSRQLKTHHQKQQRSTGLRNTSERVEILNELYRAGLKVEIEDLYAEGEAAGTRITLRMPRTLTQTPEEV